MKRSPAGPPIVPALPFPATRNREPACAPGGILTSTVSGCETRPSPWHVGQAFFSRPFPLQRGHVRLNFMAPAIWLTEPEPLHCGQTEILPLAEPVPLHVSQVSWRCTF